MSNLKIVIEICISLTQTLCCKKTEKFLSELSNDDEANYHVFGKFAGECPSVVLAVLFRLGHFAAFRQLLFIAGEVIEARRCFGENDEDVAGHIEYLLLHYRRFISTENGKFLFSLLLHLIIE